MCKAPKPPASKDPEKPEWLRNPYLDAAIGQSGAVSQLRTGRSSLRIDRAAPAAPGAFQTISLNNTTLRGPGTNMPGIRVPRSKPRPLSRGGPQLQIR